MRVARLAVALLLLALALPAAAGPVIAIAVAVAGSSIATAIGLTGIAASVFSAGFSFLVSGLFGRESAPQSNDPGSGGFSTEAQGRQQVVRSNVEPRTMVYGEVLVSGPLIFAGTTGTDNATLDLVIALAPHEVHAIGQVFFNDEPLGDLDANGAVTTGRFAGYATVTKHLGQAGQAADAGLISRHPSKWTAAHVGNGIAYVVVTLTFHRDVFPQGIPAIKAVVQGKKVYDPRTGQRAYSTNWALCVRDYLATPFIEGGIAAPDDEIDDTAITAAANICDERVAMAAYGAAATASASSNAFTYLATETRLATGDEVTLATDGMLPSPLLAATSYYVIRQDDTTARLASSYANAVAGVAIDLTTDGNGTHTLQHQTQARYTMNGTVDTSKTPLAILRSLLTGAAGAITYPNGKFTLFAAAYQAPAITLDEGDLRDAIELVAAPPRRELFNAVKGTYSDPSKAWQPGDFPAVRNPAYSAQDNGEEVFRDIELGYTTDSVRAQRLAKISLEKSRQGMTVTMPLNMRGFQLAMWDTVLVDNSAFGWSGKVFRVTHWKLGESGIGVDVTLREESAESYEWSAGEASVTDAAPDTNLPSPFVVGVPGVPAVTETLYETTGSAGVKTRADVTWSASIDPFVARYEAQFKADNDPETAWVALASVSLLSAQAVDLAPGRYDFRVRAINTLAVRSAWTETVTVEIVGLTAAPAAVANLSVIASGGFALASWDASTDLDVRLGGLLELRHSPLTTGATWENGIILKQFTGGSVTGLVPLITGTYLAKFVDSSGNYSTSAASFVATEGMVTGLSTLATITESTGFAGSKTNLTVASLTLKLSATTLIDSVSDWDSIVDMDGLGGLSPTGTYLFNTVYDGTTKAVRRFEADLAVTSSDTGDLIDARTNDIDDWASFDGATVNDTNVALYAAITDDNPAGSPTWSAWTPFMVADFNCRAAKFKAEFTSGSPYHQIAVSTLAVAVKA